MFKLKLRFFTALLQNLQIDTNEYFRTDEDKYKQCHNQVFKTIHLSGP